MFATPVNPCTGAVYRYGQTEPPTIPVDDLFEEGSFPEGEILEHPRDFNTFRVRERACVMYCSMCHGAEIGPLMVVIVVVVVAIMMVSLIRRSRVSYCEITQPVVTRTVQPRAC